MIPWSTPQICNREGNWEAKQAFLRMNSTRFMYNDEMMSKRATANRGPQLDQVEPLIHVIRMVMHLLQVPPRESKHRDPC